MKAQWQFSGAVCVDQVQTWTCIWTLGLRQDMGVALGYKLGGG